MAVRPLATELVVGVMVMPVSDGATAICAAVGAEMPPSDAPIMVLPAATPVTTPVALTVAMAVEADVQVTLLLMLAVVASV